MFKNDLVKTWLESEDNQQSSVDINVNLNLQTDAEYEIISRVPDQNGVSLLYIMLEIHHSGREPLI